MGMGLAELRRLRNLEEAVEKLGGSTAEEILNEMRALRVEVNSLKDRLEIIEVSLEDHGDKKMVRAMKSKLRDLVGA